LFFKTCLPRGNVRKYKSAEILSNNYNFCFTENAKNFYIKKIVKAGYNTHIQVFQAFLPGSQARGVVPWMKKNRTKTFKFYLKFYLVIFILNLKTQFNVKAFTYNLKKFLTKIIFFHVSKFLAKDIKNKKKMFLLKGRFLKRRRYLWDQRKYHKNWWERVRLKFQKMQTKELEDLKQEVKKKQDLQLEKLEVKLLKSLKTKKEQFEELNQIKFQMVENLNNQRFLKKKLKKKKKSDGTKLGWWLKCFRRHRIRRLYYKRSHMIWRKRAMQCLFIPYEKLVCIDITPTHQKKNFVKRRYRWDTKSNFVIIHNIEVAKQRELIKKRGFKY
jgi:hypothetical protein